METITWGVFMLVIFVAILLGIFVIILVSALAAADANKERS
jgi:hypothetical protein